jgi:hypothetical protein
LSYFKSTNGLVSAVEAVADAKAAVEAEIVKKIPAETTPVKKIATKKITAEAKTAPEKAAAEKAAAVEKATAEKPAAEKSAAQKSAAEKTAAEKTAAEKAAAEAKAAAEKTAAEKAAAEAKAAAEKATAEKAAAEAKAAAEKAAAEAKTAAEKAAAKKTAAEKAAAEKAAAAEKTAAEKTAAEKAAVEKSASEKAAAEKAAAEAKAAAEKAAAEAKAAAEKAAAEKAAAEAKAAAEKATAEKAAAEKAAAEKAAAEKAAAEKAAAEAEAAGEMDKATSSESDDVVVDEVATAKSAKPVPKKGLIARLLAGMLAPAATQQTAAPEAGRKQGSGNLQSSKQWWRHSRERTPTPFASVCLVDYFIHCCLLFCFQSDDGNSSDDSADGNHNGDDRGQDDDRSSDGLNGFSDASNASFDGNDKASSAEDSLLVLSENGDCGPQVLDSDLDEDNVGEGQGSPDFLFGNFGYSGRFQNKAPLNSGDMLEFSKYDFRHPNSTDLEATAELRATITEPLSVFPNLPEKLSRQQGKLVNLDVLRLLAIAELPDVSPLSQGTFVPYTELLLFQKSLEKLEEAKLSFENSVKLLAFVKMSMKAKKKISILKRDVRFEDQEFQDWDDVHRFQKTSAYNVVSQLFLGHECSVGALSISIYCKRRSFECFQSGGSYSYSGDEYECAFPEKSSIWYVLAQQGGSFGGDKSIFLGQLRSYMAAMCKWSHSCNGLERHFGSCNKRVKCPRPRRRPASRLPASRSSCSPFSGCWSVSVWAAHCTWAS